MTPIEKSFYSLLKMLPSSSRSITQKSFDFTDDIDIDSSKHNFKRLISKMF